MKIVPDEHRTGWKVLDNGRTVARGDIFECLRFVRNKTGTSYAAGNDETTFL